MNSIEQLLVVLAGRGSILLGGLLFIVWLLQRRWPAFAAATIHAGLVGLLALPLAGVFSPALDLPLLPRQTESSATESVAVVKSSLPTPDDAATILPAVEFSAKVPSGSTTPNSAAGPATPTAATTVAKERPWTMPSVSQLLTTVYLTGLVHAILRLMLSARNASALVRASKELVEPIWSTRLSHWQSRLSLAGVKLATTDRIGVPAVVGVLRPTILLPTAVVENQNVADSVLVHELLHVRRGDAFWQWISRIAETIYWFHPLVWFLNRSLHVVREQACDDGCARLVGKLNYRDALFEVAATRFRPLQLALGLAMARTTKLESRMNRLTVNGQYLVQRPLGGLLVALAAITAMFVAAARIVPAEAPLVGQIADLSATSNEDTPPFAANIRPVDPSNSILIRVFDEKTNAPLPGTLIRTYWTSKSLLDEEYWTTDAKGEVRVPKPRENDAMLDVLSATHIGQRWWQKGTIPGERVFRLRVGEPASGLVRDASGNPIAGAVIWLWGHEYDSPKVAENQRETLYDTPIQTGPDGRWSATCLPHKLKDISIRVEHPEFVSDRMFGSRSASLDDMRAGKAAFLMAKGVALRGRVIDAAGKPIPGVLVVAGRDRLACHEPRTTTDIDGRFRFGGLQPGDYPIVAIASGYSPESRTLNLAPEKPAADVELQLRPGTTRTGRVVDANEKPVAHAFVAIDSWRENRIIRFATFADNQGRYLLPDMPNDEITLGVSKPAVGEADVSGAGPELPVAKLSEGPIRRILVVASDKATGKPLPKFRAGNVFLPYTLESIEGRVVWNDGKNGRCEFTPMRGQESQKDWSVAAICPGYRPAVSAVVPEPLRGTTTIELKLERISFGPIAGIVLRPEGKPASGATVLLSQNQKNIWFSGGAAVNYQSDRVAKTDDAGHFVFDPRVGDMRLGASHESGYGELAATQGATKGLVLKLSEWSRLEGIVKIGSQPAANHEIRYNSRLGPGNDLMRYEVKTLTDDRGRFRFDQIPSGPGAVYMMVPTKSYWDGRYNGGGWGKYRTEFHADPGIVTRVDLGGKGRPVIGRINLPDELARKVIYNCVGGPDTRIETDKPSDAAPVEAWLTGIQSFFDWSRNHPKEVMAHAAGRQRMVLEVDQDGRFQATDVPAGDYELVVIAGERQGTRQSPRPAKVWFRFTHAFMVPEMPGGRSDTPLDLGEFRVDKLPTLEWKKQAPPLLATDLDGKPMPVEGLRGKRVIVVFWSATSKRCLDDIEKIRKVHDKLTPTGKVALVSINIDADAELWRKTVAERKMTWLQGHAPPGSPILETYFVRGTPSIELIYPDGSLVMSTALWEGDLVNSVLNVVSSLEKERYKP